VEAPAGAERRPGFFFRRLSTTEEFRAVEEVQNDAWGLGPEPAVPSPLLRAFQDNAGLLLGAFTPHALVGFTMGFLGREGTSTFHYSHMTAVRREFQNRHLGFELKLFQREEVLNQGLDEIRWTFDPLQSKNAMLNVRRLGGLPDRYYPHYYGTLADSLNEGMETDRLRLVWSLSSPRVKERITTGPPDVALDSRRWKESFALVETVLRPSGARMPVRIRSPEGSEVNLEIPYDLARVRTAEPGAAKRWRAAVREAFLASFRVGYRVDDFAAIRPEGESRSFYLLRAPEGSHAA
jgi:predicted GNAT superfamily acetyltransferase